jgi:hypothetical protein
LTDELAQMRERLATRVLAAHHVRAWSEAGRPGRAGLHIDAYPRSPACFSADETRLPGGALITDRPGTRFAVYHD